MSEYFLNLEEEEKVYFLLNVLYGESIKMLINLKMGYKDFDDLTTPLTYKDICKRVPDCCSKIMKIKHCEMSEKVLSIVKRDPDIFQIDEKDLKFFEPVIQSGGYYTSYDKCEDNKNYLSHDVVIIFLKVKYKHIFSTLIRTTIFAPVLNLEVKENYNFLLRVEKFIVDELHDGVELGKVYQATIDCIAKEKCFLLKHLSDNFGSVLEIKFRDEDFSIKANSKAIAKKDMIFNVNVGFNSIFDPSLMKNPPHTYSLWIGDCVRVEKDGPATFLNRVTYEFDHIIYYETKIQSKDTLIQSNTNRRNKYLKMSDCAIF